MGGSKKKTVFFVTTSSYSIILSNRKVYICVPIQIVFKMRFKAKAWKIGGSLVLTIPKPLDVSEGANFWVTLEGVEFDETEKTVVT